jgi:hypothetical protein
MPENPQAIGKDSVAGGLCLRLLTERYQACKYNTVAHFLQRDDGTREFIKWQFEIEKKKRQVLTKKGSLFFRLGRSRKPNEHREKSFNHIEIILCSNESQNRSQL